MPNKIRRGRSARSADSLPSWQRDRGFSSGGKVLPLIAALRAADHSTPKGREMFRGRLEKKFGAPEKGSRYASGDRGSITREHVPSIAREADNRDDPWEDNQGKRKMPRTRSRARYEEAGENYGGFGRDSIGGRSHFREWNRKWRRKRRKERGAEPSQPESPRGYKPEEYKGYPSKFEYLMRGSFGHPLKRTKRTPRVQSGSSGGSGALSGARSGAGQQSRPKRRGRRRTFRVGIM